MKCVMGASVESSEMLTDKCEEGDGMCPSMHV